MIRLEIKNYNIISAEKLQFCHQVKLTNKNILQVKKDYLLIKENRGSLVDIFSLRKSFKKHTKTIDNQG